MAAPPGGYLDVLEIQPPSLGFILALSGPVKHPVIWDGILLRNSLGPNSGALLRTKTVEVFT
jgi:hypothetical protein